MTIDAIVTVPPYAPFMDDVLRKGIVSGIRLNTVMPIKGSLEENLKRLNAQAQRFGKELWIDLKCRQLRVTTYGVPPFTEIELSHDLQVDTPTKAYFSDGEECATVLHVDRNRLIMLEGPKRVIGPGESVNIPHPSLRIGGYFTDTDKRYIDAANATDIHNYMLSFVEQRADAQELCALDPKARVIEKIESKRGMRYATDEWHRGTHGDRRLMAARGDLYVELMMPHYIVDAVETIVKKDADAVVGSRIFNSLSRSLEPSCQDIGDVNNLMRMGYRTFMLGDDICMQKDSVVSGLNLLTAMAESYESKNR